jgi:hypothetical protein
MDQHSPGRYKDDKKRASAGLQAVTENKDQDLMRISEPPRGRYRCIPQRPAKQLIQQKKPKWHRE